MHTQNVNVKTAAQETAGRCGKPQNIVLSQNLPPLRGLDVRMAWGMAQVMRVIDSEKAIEEMDDAILDALLDGHRDFGNGEQVPPGMYADVPQLVEAWRQGWQSAAESDAMDGCPGCHNERGEPCPWHD